MASNFESSFVGVACTVFTSECMWLKFRECLVKLGDDDRSCDSELRGQLVQNWRQYLKSLVSMMGQFNVSLCGCRGDDSVCSFSHMCRNDADLSAVSEGHYSARVISIRLFQLLLPLWRGILEEEEEEENRSRNPGVYRSVSSVREIFLDDTGNHLVLQALSLLISSAKIVDHSCVMSRALRQGGLHCILLLRKSLSHTCVA